VAWIWQEPISFDKTYQLRRIYTSSFRMRFPHCVAIFYNLPWFCSIKVSYKKSQRNVVNACGNRMCKLSFNSSKKMKKMKTRPSFCLGGTSMRQLAKMSKIKKEVLMEPILWNKSNLSLKKVMDGVLGTSI